MAMKLHPDSKDGSEDKFKSLSEAYQTLSDPEEKHVYDMKIGNRAEANVYSDIAQKERDILQQELRDKMNEPKRVREEREQQERELMMRRKEKREKMRMMEFINMFTIKDPKNPNKVEREISALYAARKE